MTPDHNHDHQDLLSAHQEKIEHIHILERRVVATQNTITALRSKLGDVRQAHQDEIKTCTHDVMALRSAEAATAQDVRNAEETLRRAELRQTTEVGTAQAELDRAKAKDKKTLKGQPCRQAQHLAALDARQDAFRAGQDSLETQGRELETCFDEHEPQWREMQEDVAEL